ncbi:hypothetical protein HMPREF0281_02341 [Corynebacterium ammoniagenes DSM 20306]|uniref:Uncharacterized protein n=1 Tax=Corynebacterium ammoniagenes DSM 20306 TaxID=649754 RepID=A0ABN0AC34_CORAM|nr:hypothetical protein HMPREF0281_02341 [Corynebacterium ammoniagenes DSM 20306]
MVVAGNVGLDACDDLHIWCQIMVQDLLTGGFQAGLIVLVAEFDQYIACAMQPTRDSLGIASQDLCDDGGGSRSKRRCPG